MLVRYPCLYANILTYICTCVCVCVYIHRSPRQGTKRRQKLLEQISSGLTENHYKEMEHLSAGAVDLIAHLLQPNPAKRARLFETMGHPWITRDGLQPLEPYKQPAIDHSLQTAVSTSGMWFVRM